MLRLIPHIVTLSLLFALVIPSTGTGAQSQKPISQKGLTEALRINGLTTEELIEHVERRGVDFELTADIERELRAAGARPELLAAVRFHQRAGRGLELKGVPEVSPTIQTGSYHALIIGNNAYEFMLRLKTAESDGALIPARRRAAT